MAIAYSTSSFLGNVASASYDAGGSGSNVIFFVGVVGDTTDNQPTVTYNSVPMTFIAKDVAKAGERYIYLYYLVNPASGSNTIASSGSTVSVLFMASYTGAKQSSQPDNSTHGNSTGGSITLNLTPVATGCWAVSIDGNELGTRTAGAGVTVRTTNGSLGDSNGIISGSTSMTWTDGGSGGTMSGVMASFAPVDSGGGLSTYKTLLGVGI